MKASNFFKALTFLFIVSLIKVIPGYSQSYSNLCLTGADNLERGNLDDALTSFNAAITKSPGKWHAYDYRAQVYLQKENYNDAIADATKAISLSAPQKNALYYLRGNCYLLKKDFESAIADYSVVLKNDANNEFAKNSYKKRGDCYYSINQFENAIKDYSKLVEINTKANVADYETYYKRGLAYISVSKFKEASDDFGMYLKYAPANSQALFYQGYSLVKSGDNAKALELANNLLSQDPSKETIYKGLNVLSIFDNNYRRSNTRRLFESAQKSMQEYREIPSKSLGNIKLEQAFVSLDSAWLYCYPLPDKIDIELKDSVLNGLMYVYPLLKVKPEISENVRRYAVQANTATEEKKYDEATALWGKAISIAPYYPLSYYNRALLASMSNNYQGAISDMKKYIELSPDAKDVRTAKDKIYEWEAKNKTAQTSSYYSLKDPKSLEHVYNITLMQRNRYYFAAAGGGSIGMQFGENETLNDFWNEIANPPYDKYSGTDIHAMASGSFELMLKPVSLIGVGYSMGILGGLGASNGAQKVHLTSFQKGYFVRVFFNKSKGVMPTPEFFLQYGFGQNRLDGYTGTVSNGLFTYTKSLEGTAPYKMVGAGICGKVTGNFYMQVSFNYYSSTVEHVTYRVTVDDVNDPSTLDQTGDFTTSAGVPISINYQGIIFTWLFGVCF